MKAVIQRVRRGTVRIGQQVVGEIDQGLVILLGVEKGDTRAEAQWVAEKCAHLRIFEDPQGKMNLSALDIAGKALVVSQFTLLADARKGRRPSFVRAADPPIAESLVHFFIDCLVSSGIPTQSGQFGAHMVVEIENDGPVTIVLERRPPDAEG
jgi:D-tyrosyl-tRNA(Tyr) deacylase